MLEHTHRNSPPEKAAFTRVAAKRGMSSRRQPNRCACFSEDDPGISILALDSPNQLAGPLLQFSERSGHRS